MSGSRFKDYAVFIKLRLAVLVVLSAAICYAAAAETIDWSIMGYLVLGGFLVTGSSNGFNQYIERHTDKLMNRTSSRPLPSDRMTGKEAIIIATITGIAGIFILYRFINPLSAILGALALILYTVVYTPMKKQTPFAVFIGAFPGAIPPLLGVVAASGTPGEFSLFAWLMFSVQFIWQFPHFWAIAWVLDEDYNKAGFKMLPSPGGRDKSSAFQILIYSLSLIPISLLPVFFGLTGNWGAISITILGILFAVESYKLYRTCDIKQASRLMFASFIYLPITQLVYLFDKI